MNSADKMREYQVARLYHNTFDVSVPEVPGVSGSKLSELALNAVSRGEPITNDELQAAKHLAVKIPGAYE